MLNLLTAAVPGALVRKLDISDGVSQAIGDANALTKSAEAARQRAPRFPCAASQQKRIFPWVLKLPFRRQRLWGQIVTFARNAFSLREVCSSSKYVFSLTINVVY